MKIIVYGSPAPQGSKAFKGVFTGKDGRQHARLVESSKKVKPWREDVKSASEKARNGAAPMDGPLLGRMVFTMHKPKSAPKRKRTYPCTMPDLSKLLRSTEDALKQAGVIADDARIVEYSRLAKVYPNEDPEALEAPGVRIEIVQLELVEASVLERAMQGQLTITGCGDITPMQASIWERSGVPHVDRR